MDETTTILTGMNTYHFKKHHLAIVHHKDIKHQLINDYDVDHVSK